MFEIGLRVDVDTMRGTRYGVPNLCKLFAEKSILATFFFSVGPDNMGRNLRRLIRPSFFYKMIRSGASNLYGWDILFKGTLWEGPVIGKRLAPVIGSASNAGHEIGLHAWDHYSWQANIDAMSNNSVYLSIKKGFDLLSRITGSPPTCSAVPGWKCNETVLLEKAKFPFKYNSDCRGESIFNPIICGGKFSQVQIPTTLPTYDEVIHRNGVSDKNYNTYMLSLIKPDKLNVLTIHAEVEGIACLDMFEDFLEAAESTGATLVPLGNLLTENRLPVSDGHIVKKSVQGREGWVAWQTPVDSQ